MREIKFRVYDKNKKLMRYDITGCEFYTTNNELKLSGVFLDGDFYDIEDIELMQYTGFDDKNGTEIYEGDRVYIIPEDEYGEVEWDDETARYNIIFDNVITDFDNWHSYDLEVVGAIYDN